MKLNPPAMNPDMSAFHPSSLFLTTLNKHWTDFNKNVYNPINSPNWKLVLTLNNLINILIN